MERKIGGNMMKKMGLAMQILLGLIVGIIVGAIFYGNPGVETYLKPIGDIFLRLTRLDEQAAHRARTRCILG